ncbi:PadR family transcriptional regulator [Actinospica robiniae]|uniref:PadR family transcriptional regulator n=1 Tax=Actinospica robiniae TaxID=304901 RepID=UPI00041E6250|nr:PadR family transcriptional regulator [Actinospica robiniae]
MSIKHGILALLRDQPGYGYQLRAELAEATGPTWPVNIGQIYSTLARLERDGLVARTAEHAQTAEDADGHVVYEITQEGTGELEGWLARPITRDDRPRNEPAIKLALAVTVPGVDVAAVVQGQRAHVQAELRELTRRKLRAGVPQPAWSLVLEVQIFQAEAEIRWLDHVEGQVCRKNG